MRINYIYQIRSFNDRLLSNPLSSGQIALWHALMHINNKCAWIEWFTAPNLSLEALCGLSRQGINKARNVLKQEGLIDFKSNGTKATSYKINILYDHLTSYSVQDSIQSSVQGGVQDSIQSSVQNSSTLNKQDKTKLNKTIDASAETAVSYWLNQVNPTEAPSILESIAMWVQDFGDKNEIVIMAIEEMLKNNARSYKYLDKILKTWEANQLDTVVKIQNYLDGHFNKKNQKYRNPQTRKEKMPKYITDQPSDSNVDTSPVFVAEEEKAFE